MPFPAAVRAGVRCHAPPAGSYSSDYIVFDGDSLTSGSGATGGQTYPVQMAVQLPGLTYSNLGVAGQTAADMLSDATTQVDALYNGAKTDYVAMWAGINDIYNSVAPATVLTNLAQYGVGRLAAGFRPFVATITDSDLISGGNETNRQTLNTNIRNNYLAFAYDLFDLGNEAHIGPDGSAADGTYFSDQTHLTNAGYAIVASMAKDAFLRTRAAAGAVIRDRFNRTDSGSSLGNAETGQAWTAGVGTWGIASSRAYCATPAGQNVAYIDAGAANVAVTLQLPTISDYCGIVFRCVDANNWLLFNVIVDSGRKFSAYKMVDSVLTCISTPASTGSAADGDVLGVVANGSSIKCYVNGALIFDITNTTFQTATKVGFWTDQNAARFDNFCCRVVS